MRTLLIEDNREISKNIRRYLELDGWTVDVAFDGTSGLSAALGNSYDIVLLDCTLPAMDGVEVCEKIRAAKDIPVIMITARDDLADKVVGIESGADDYLVKPFDLKELEIRMYAVLRRTKKESFKEISYRDVTIDLRKRIVRKGGISVHIPTKEFLILEYLITREGMATSRTDIIGYVWGGEAVFENDRLDVYISWLRKKLYPDMIKTIKNYGYAFNVE